MFDKRRFRPDAGKMDVPRIGFLFGSTDYNGYEIHLLEGALASARELGVRLVCLDVGYATDSLLYSILDRHHLDGLVFSPTVSPRSSASTLPEFFEPYVRRGLPVVSIALEAPPISSVVCDNAVGMNQLMEHLLGVHGYRRPAYIGGPSGQQESETRRAVFHYQVAEAGITLRPDRIVYGNFSQESGFAIVRDWLSQGALDVDVIVCANDGMAFGATRALREAGISVPEDVAVTGFDNDPEGLIQDSPLTTVDQGTVEQAAEALRLVVSLLRNGGPGHQIVLPSRLEVRSSCGCQSPSRSLLRGDWERVLHEPMVRWAAGRGDAALLAVLSAVGVEELGAVQDACFRLCREQRPPGDWESLAQVFSQQWSRRETKSRLRTEDQAKEIIQMGSRLGTCRSREALRSTLSEVLDAAALKRLGYRGLWLSHFLTPESPLAGLEPQLSVDLCNTPAPVGPEASFANELLPGGVAGLNACHEALLVEVLQQQDGPLGVLVFSLDQDQVKMTGAIRNLLAGAFQNVRLTEQRQAAELQMAHSARLATMGSMVAGLAHKINTPLGNAVLGASFLREKALGLDADLSALVEAVTSNLGKVADLVEVFRGVASLPANQIRAKFDLRELLTGVVKQLQLGSERRPPSVELVCPVGLSLDSYPESIIRIVSVLFKNALTHAFGPEEPGNLSMAATPGSDGKRITLVFADNGRGIPPGSVDHIFEPFYSSMKNHSGIGLDLHIVNHLVTDILGGTITCQSRLGEGTEFTLDVPRVAPQPRSIH